MKFKSVSLKFTDIDENNTKLEIILDPPLDGDKKLTEADVEEQPCMELANQVITYLNWLKAKYGKPKEDEGVIEVGEQGNLPQTVH